MHEEHESRKKRPLWQRTMAKAASSPGNVVTGALTLVASAALWNPLPVILWGLGSGAWVILASGSQRYRRAVAEDEQRTEREIAERWLASLHSSLETHLARQPCRAWIQRGLIPDYIVQFHRLVVTRENIAGVLQERGHLAIAGVEDLPRQLEHILRAYLQFASARVTCLLILASVRPTVAPTPDPPDTAKRTRVQRPTEEAVAVPVPDVQVRLAALDRRIQELGALARSEPATAKTRQWHISILNRQKELLTEVHKRDQLLEAQLTAIPDMFDVILSRLQTAQYDPQEVVSYMGSIVEQVEDTERFVDELRPQMDEVFSVQGLETA